MSGLCFDSNSIHRSLLGFCIRDHARSPIPGQYDISHSPRPIPADVPLTETLEKSDYHDDLDHIVSCFDKTTKVWFGDDQKAQFIRFGSTRDNDTEHDIRFGQLKLSG